MKGTRPLDNDEIRNVSTCFTEIVTTTQFSNRAVVSPETSSLGVRKPLDSCGISTTKLGLTLLIFGLNKR